MTTITLDAGYSLFDRSANRGASKESAAVEMLLTRHFNELRDRASRKQSFIELDEVAAQVASGAEVNLSAEESMALIPMACRFLNALPSYLPSPSVDIDPDGEVVFDWVFGRNRMLTITLGEYGKLSFAGVFGPASKLHGTEIFDDAIPEEIIRCIKRVQAKQH